MSQPNPSRRRGAPRAAVFALLAAALCLGAHAARAQSGRKAQKPLGLPTAEAPKTGDPAAARPESKKPEAAVSLIVMRSDDANFAIDQVARDGVAAAFVRRLEQAATVEVTNAGKGRRQDARARSREEKKAFVVLFQLDEQAGDMSMGRADSRLLVVRTYVYAPQTGDLKYNDTVYQRPYYDSARVGGVRIPVPTRRVERYPSQYELEQAGRDAADRLLSRFNVTPPPENQ
ncbi:MAG TPA: hypothetical protein VF659_15990 [Pyrinomonadaceae bacterium]|jgi:hypothetical protein